MGNATIEHTFYVDTPNKVGEAYRLSNWLYDSFGSNIKTFYGASHENNGRFWFIAENEDAVKSGFDNSDYSKWGEEDVVVCRTPDQPGECARITKLLADNGLNIKFIYTTIYDSKPAVIFSTDDNKRAASLF